jgi:hypothetical protein
MIQGMGGDYYGRQRQGKRQLYPIPDRQHNKKAIPEFSQTQGY